MNNRGKQQYTGYDPGYTPGYDPSFFAAASERKKNIYEFLKKCEFLSAEQCQYCCYMDSDQIGQYCLGGSPLIVYNSSGHYSPGQELGDASTIQTYLREAFPLATVTPFSVLLESAVFKESATALNIFTTYYMKEKGERGGRSSSPVFGSS